MYLKLLKFIFVSSFFMSSLYGMSFSKKAEIEPVYVQKGDGKQWCPVSGLSLKEFYKTSYIAKLKMNANVRQYASISALVIDMQEYGIDENSIKVLDLTSQKYIKVKDAFFVVNSRIPGTLSKVSKFAFKNKDDALKFKKRYKGKLTDFDTALKMAKESLKKDQSRALKKKKKKIYPRGKKIYDRVCQKDKIDPMDYIEINELKHALVYDKLCRKLREKDLQALALYLWEVERFGGLGIDDRVKVEEYEKCPVCGMFTYKYPRWAAQVFYEENGVKKHWSFDGVKDLMKFYFDPMKWGNYKIAKQKNITKILVTDYYTQKGIDGTKAFYVIRSDIYGPMGHELIPFESLEDAQTFKKDHFGKKILEFKDIKEDQVYKLDYNE